MHRDIRGISCAHTRRDVWHSAALYHGTRAQPAETDTPRRGERRSSRFVDAKIIDTELKHRIKKGMLPRFLHADSRFALCVAPYHLTVHVAETPRATLSTWRPSARLQQSSNHISRTEGFYINFFHCESTSSLMSRLRHTMPCQHLPQRDAELQVDTCRKRALHHFVF